MVSPFNRRNDPPVSRGNKKATAGCPAVAFHARVPTEDQNHYRFFFLWRFLRSRFFRLWVAIL